MAARPSIALALLVRDGSVLLVHRHPARPYYPDSWDLVGGHVDRGETPQDAVIRECREEIGVLVHDPSPIPLAHDDASLEVHAFPVARWDGNPINAAPEEHDDLRWFRPDELDSLPLAHDSSRLSILSAERQAAEL